MECEEQATCKALSEESLAGKNDWFCSEVHCQLVLLQLKWFPPSRLQAQPDGTRLAKQVSA